MTPIRLMIFGVKEKPKFTLTTKRSIATGAKTNAGCVSERSGAIEERASTPRKASPKRPPSTAPVKMNTAHIPKPRPEENFTKTPPKETPLASAASWRISDKSSRSSSHIHPAASFYQRSPDPSTVKRRCMIDCSCFFLAAQHKSCSTKVISFMPYRRKNLPRERGRQKSHYMR